MIDKIKVYLAFVIIQSAKKSRTHSDSIQNFHLLRKYFRNLFDFTPDDFCECLNLPVISQLPLLVLLPSCCRGRPQHLRNEKQTELENQQQQQHEDVSDEESEEASVISQLTNRVQDGTRCRPGSLDMCIQGKCQVSVPFSLVIYWLWRPPIARSS